MTIMHVAALSILTLVAACTIRRTDSLLCADAAFHFPISPCLIMYGSSLASEARVPRARPGAAMKTGQVFLSHTSDMAAVPQCRSFVQAALDAVCRAGMAPVDMRYFPAREGVVAEYCRQRVRDCEVYVAVIGFRYGSLVPGTSVSYTELEFQEAGTAGLPRLVFLLDGNDEYLQAWADTDRRAVEAFRGRLRAAGAIVRSPGLPRGCTRSYGCRATSWIHSSTRSCTPWGPGSAS
jgi:hypothetical protein